MSKARDLGNLGSDIGTAATADVTTHTQDSTAGRLWKIGDWIHTNRATYTSPYSNVPDTFLGYVSGSATGYPTNVDVGGAFLKVTSGAGTVQTFSLRGSGNVYHTGNLLGTVSQSAGVPTGAVIEAGSNGNGNYVKFADGTLICSFYQGDTTTTINIGNYHIQGILSFPATFVGDCSITVSTYPTNGSGTPLACSVWNHSQVAWNIGIINNSAEQMTRYLWTNFTAIGRWF